MLQLADIGRRLRNLIWATDTSKRKRASSALSLHMTLQKQSETHLFDYFLHPYQQLKTNQHQFLPKALLNDVYLDMNHHYHVGLFGI